MDSVRAPALPAPALGYTRVQLSVEGDSGIEGQRLWIAKQGRLPVRPPTDQEREERREAVVALDRVRLACPQCGSKQSNVTQMNRHRKKCGLSDLPRKKVDCLVCGLHGLETTNYCRHHCLDFQEMEQAQATGIPTFVTCGLCGVDCYPAGLRAHRCNKKRPQQPEIQDATEEPLLTLLPPLKIRRKALAPEIGCLPSSSSLRLPNASRLVLSNSLQPPPVSYPTGNRAGVPTLRIRRKALPPPGLQLAPRVYENEVDRELSEPLEEPLVPTPTPTPTPKPLRRRRSPDRLRRKSTVVTDSEEDAFEDAKSSQANSRMD
jgi:hypothetical protein